MMILLSDNKNRGESPFFFGILPKSEWLGEYRPSPVHYVTV